jgi:hypothetical protein
MKYILEYKIWDFFKKKDKTPKINWEEIALKLVDYYIEKDIPVQIKSSFGMWEQFPYRLKDTHSSIDQPKSFSLWPPPEFNTQNGLDSSEHWKIEIRKESRETKGFLNGHQQVGVIYIQIHEQTFTDPSFISDESFKKMTDLYNKQLFKWGIFNELFYDIRKFDRYDEEGGFDNGLGFWNHMSKYNDDYSFFKYPNIVNWYRYVDCIISESDGDELKKDSIIFNDFKKNLKDKGFKIV